MITNVQGVERYDNGLGNVKGKDAASPTTAASFECTLGFFLRVRKQM